MAIITMPLDRRARLPRLCIVCGTRDCDFERVTIRPSVGAGGMVALANREGYSTLSLTLPLCQHHRYHFALQTFLRYGVIAGVMGVALLGLVLLAIVGKGWVIGVIMGAILAVVAVWVVVSMTLNKSRVHVSGFTGDTVELSNVSSKFANAYKDQDEDEDDEEEDRAPRRSKRKKRRVESDEDDEEEDFNFDRR
jgi:hypothetical protein